MTRIGAVLRRELASYFLSPVAYVVMAVFAMIYGIFFNGIFITYGVANLQLTFSNLIVVLLFMAPIMTMRSLAEERKLGTEELLMTAPVSTSEIVLGKFCALLGALGTMLALLLIHLGIILSFAQPDLGPIIAGLFGLLLLGATFTAIGLFTSALSDNQIVAGLISFGILLLLWLMDWLGDSVGGKIGEAVSSLSLMKHYDDFSKGIVDSSNVIFYLSVLAFFILLTIWRVESRRWRR
ncbi:MAG: ABC transporter permease [Bacillota bacterium]